MTILPSCRIRKDLVESETAVPIMRKDKQHFIHSNAWREYRYLDDNTFQIFYRDNWWDAYSIDFDFN